MTRDVVGVEVVARTNDVLCQDPGSGTMNLRCVWQQRLLPDCSLTLALANDGGRTRMTVVCHKQSSKDPGVV